MDALVADHLSSSGRACSLSVFAAEASLPPPHAGLGRGDLLALLRLDDAHPGAGVALRRMLADGRGGADRAGSAPAQMHAVTFAGSATLYPVRGLLDAIRQGTARATARRLRHTPTPKLLAGSMGALLLEALAAAAAGCGAPAPAPPVPASAPPPGDAAARPAAAAPLGVAGQLRAIEEAHARRYNKPQAVAGAGIISEGASGVADLGFGNGGAGGAAALEERMARYRDECDALAAVQVEAAVRRVRELEVGAARREAADAYRCVCVCVCV